MGLLTFLDLHCPDGDHRQLQAKVRLTINSQGEIISTAPVALFCSFHQMALTKTFQLLSFQTCLYLHPQPAQHSPSPTDTEAQLCRGASKCGRAVSSCIFLHNLHFFFVTSSTPSFLGAFLCCWAPLDTIYHLHKRHEKVKLQEEKTSN